MEPPPLSLLRARPPCPAPTDPWKINKTTWKQNQRIMQWRASYETFEEYVSRCKMEHRAMRKRPRRRRRSKIDVDASLAKYKARLTCAPHEMFKIFASGASVLSTYAVTSVVDRDDVDSTPNLPPSLVLLWKELCRRGVTPLSIVPHTAKWNAPRGSANRYKIFTTKAPPGATRVFIGQRMELQHNTPHPLSYGRHDFVSV